MIKRASIVLALLLVAGRVSAQECPADVPEDPGQRRQLAKKWFSKGESAAKAGDDLAALKAYQCSLSFVPHEFTAFNVGQLAEKIGDLDLAIASYEQYLSMVPDAADAKELSQRIDVLKERLAKAQAGDTSTGPPLDQLIGKSHQESFPEPVVQPKPAVAEPTPVPSVSATSGRPRMRTLGYITAGSGAVLVLGGVLSNLLARGQMDTCRSEYERKDQSAAELACSNAKPLAYLSYGLIGVGAAAVATGAVLMFLPARQASDEVALDVLPEGGLSLRYAGRF
jgi:tetratricopeptide (TPR) repeat protein